MLVEPTLLELELVEVEEGLLVRAPWSLDGGDERLFITGPFDLAAGIRTKKGK